MSHDGKDSELRKVLHEWRGIEPVPDFEARVWSRIRTSAAEPVPGFGSSLWDSVLAVAASLLLALGIGLIVPATALRAKQELIRRPGLQEIHGQGTITGDYLHTMKERQP